MAPPAPLAFDGAPLCPELELPHAVPSTSGNTRMIVERARSFGFALMASSTFLCREPPSLHENQPETLTAPVSKCPTKRRDHEASALHVTVKSYQPWDR